MFLIHDTFPTTVLLTKIASQKHANRGKTCNETCSQYFPFQLFVFQSSHGTRIDASFVPIILPRMFGQSIESKYQFYEWITPTWNRCSWFLLWWAASCSMGHVMSSINYTIAWAKINKSFHPIKYCWNRSRCAVELWLPMAGKNLLRQLQMLFSRADFLFFFYFFLCKTVFFLSQRKKMPFSREFIDSFKYSFVDWNRCEAAAAATDANNMEWCAVCMKRNIPMHLLSKNGVDTWFSQTFSIQLRHLPVLRLCGVDTLMPQSIYDTS